MQTAGSLTIQLAWLKYSARLWRDLPEGSPVYFYLHGFAGSGGDCSFLRSKQGTFDRCWLSMDWLGHGESAAPDVGEVYGLNWQLEGIRRLAQLFRNQRRILVGYSMGARLALHAALRFPGLFEELALISGTAGIEEAYERRQRRLRDQRWAEMIRVEGLGVFAREWEKQPVISSQESMPPETLDFWRNRRRNHSTIGLAHSVQALSPGVLPAVWHQLHRISCPVKVFAGESDSRFCDQAVRLAKNLPNAEMIVMENCNHCLHMENAAGFLERL